MLNRPWIDPRSVDWTDALNPLRNPGWSRNNNPFVFAALKDPFFQGLRLAKGIEPRIFVCPEPSDQLIPAGSTFDYEVPTEPNTWLWALNANASVDPDHTGPGPYLVNVIDSATGAALFSQPVRGDLVLDSRTFGTAGRGVQTFLSTPHLFLPPSYPVVRIINTFTDPQIIRVTLFTCAEYNL